MVKKTQLAEKIRERGYHVTEHLNFDIGHLYIWKHGDYICKLTYFSNFNGSGSYVSDQEYLIPEDVKEIIKNYS